MVLNGGTGLIIVVIRVATNSALYPVFGAVVRGGWV